MYNAKQAYNAYSRDKVLTASPVELIIMLYDEAIKQLKMADIAIEAKNFEKANVSLQKVLAILDELIKSLDLTIQIGKDLLEIYQFVCKSVIDINVKKDREAIPPIIEVLNNLREAWVGVKVHESKMFSTQE